MTNRATRFDLFCHSRQSRLIDGMDADMARGTNDGTVILTLNPNLYSVRAQEGPQEIERNEAAARHSWAR